MIDTQIEIQCDKRRERTQARLQELLQKSFVCNKLDKVLCTNYFIQNKFRVDRMVAGTVFVPASFKSKLPVVRQ